MIAQKSRAEHLRRLLMEQYQIYILLAVIMAYYIVFSYLPMAGLKMAFQEFNPVLGLDKSPYVGLAHFVKFLTGKYFLTTLVNTLNITVYSLVVTTILPILFALIVNSMRNARAKKMVETVAYAPHFISTVVVVGMLKIFLSTGSGVVNALIAALGFEKIPFFAKAAYFPGLYVWSGVWQELGWSSVIYLSALAGVDPGLHEAAVCDGASRVRRLWHIDLPGIRSTVMILLIMKCGSLMSVGFEKVYLMQTQTNVAASEVISTYAYKLGMQQAQYSYSAAVGMFNSVVSLALLAAVNACSRRLTEESLW